MLSTSAVLLIILNVIILVSAIFHIIMATNSNYVSTKSPCLRGSADSLLWAGIFVSAASVVGILGSCCKVKALQSIYLWVLLITTTATVIFFTFIAVLMPKHTSIEIYQQTAKDGFWLKAYKPALQSAIVNERDWFQIKNCYIQTKICDVMRNQTQDQKVSYIEFGCCIPPNRCGMVQKNMTSWEAPETGLWSKDDECESWMKVGGACFDCDSCKAGYLAYYQDEWDKNIGNQIIRILILVVTSALACSAFLEDPYDVNDPKNGKRVHRI